MKPQCCRSCQQSSLITANSFPQKVDCSSWQPNDSPAMYLLITNWDTRNSYTSLMLPGLMTMPCSEYLRAGMANVPGRNGRASMPYVTRSHYSKSATIQGGKWTRSRFFNSCFISRQRHCTHVQENRESRCFRICQFTLPWIAPMPGRPRNSCI